LYGLLQLNTKSERKSPLQVQGFISQALCLEATGLRERPALLYLHHCTVLIANTYHCYSASYGDFCYFLNSNSNSEKFRNVVSSSVVTLTMQSQSRLKKHKKSDATDLHYGNSCPILYF